MKVKIFTSIIVFILSAGSIFGQKRFPDADPLTASVKGKGNFIELNDGTIIESKKVSFRKPMFGKATFNLDDGKTFPEEDVVAYQIDNKYNRKFKKYDYVLRIISGKINVYTELVQGNADAVTGGKANVHQYYIQKGDTGVIKFLLSSYLKEMVEDDVATYEIIKNVNKNNTTSGKLVQAITMYNARK